ncbi:PfkB family carbohydrate kinase [Geminicoccus roseus]|uniref:PfkB family carbohydrate kinase n=1 Tax=Geminicoccus roseus TaxID=404900 RepID=UPI000416B9B7|nr:PfkB family carbohydrate kinase [Geminicoccus roseus]
MSTVLVLGNAAIDLTLRMERLPENGETVLAAHNHQDVGGKGLNQAVMARRAGASVRLAAAVGEDGDAAAIRHALAASGIAATDLIPVAAATDRSIVLLGAGGDNMIVTVGDAARSIGPDFAMAACAGLERDDILLVQGNLRADATVAALEAARRRGVRTMANPAPLWFDWSPMLPLLDLVVVNEVEERQIGGAGGAETLIVTLGRRGAEIRRDSGRHLVAAPPVEARDTTGAGDVLVGVLTAGLAGGMELDAALAWGVAAASTKVQRFGTLAAFPDAAKLAKLRP